jgi:arginyl-tRNA synthetase
VVGPLPTLRQRFGDALAAAFGPDHAAVDPVLRRSQQDRFGDYQANVAMGLSKALRSSPREVAAAIVEHLDVADVCDHVEVAGPGFVNLTLRADFLEAGLAEAEGDERRARRPPRDGGGRLLGSERGQGDARRPPAQHRDR